MSEWRVYGAGPDKARRTGEFRAILAQARLPDSAAAYLPNDGLIDAVNVSIALGQPLLLTGDPGTGKTQLAYSVAHQLFRARPVVFNTKTTSTARDLFYTYDALRHFRDAQLRKDSGELNPEDYITYEALGLAIIRAMPRDKVPAPIAERLGLGDPTQSVVLLDEIDKAPRDLPNDVLNEIENMSFYVRETGQPFGAGSDLRPIVIMTSNSEKLLPEAFLRRCIFYHLEFPKGDQLLRIVKGRIQAGAWVERAVSQFELLRSKPLKRPPATAELLAWLRVLQRLSDERDGRDPLDLPTYPSSLTVLAKNKDDLKLLQDLPRPGTG